MIKFLVRCFYPACWSALLLSQVASATSQISYDPLHSRFCERLLNPPSHSQLTYKTRLVIEAEGQASKSLEETEEKLIQHFYNWVVSSYTDLSQMTLAQFRADHAQSLKNTDFAGRRFENHWSFVVERTQPQTSRRWRSEVAITRDATSNRIIVHIRVLNWVTSPTALGQNEFSVPRVVRSIIAEKSWRVSTGDMLIPPSGESLSLSSELNQIQYYRKILTEAGSRLPIIYVSVDPHTNGYNVDPGQLARDFEGLAIVIRENNLATQSALRHLLPESHRVWNGAIRVYLPNVDFNKQHDTLRHRYFTADTIRELGPLLRDRLFQVLLAWQEQSRPENEVALLSDLSTLELRKMAEELKGQHEKLLANNDSSVYQELIGILEEEQRQMREKIRQLQANLETTATNWQSSITELENLKVQMATRERQLLENGKPKSGLTSHLNGNGHGNGHSPSQSLSLPSRIPTEVREVVELFAEAYPNRLFISKRAIQSAKRTSFDNPSVAWEILHEMATTLYDLYFEKNENSNLIPDLFQASTGYELVPNEGTYTKKIPKFKKLRELEYEGKTVDIQAHIKYGNRAPKLLRVHFYVDREKKRIVIGHFGDHLENGSTSYQ